MYSVKSIIIKLPYGRSGFKFNGSDRHLHYIEWFRRHDQSAQLTGFTMNEAGLLKKYLETNCSDVLGESTVQNISELEIPHAIKYKIPENEFPKYYPFEDLQRFGIIDSIPFNFDIIGYNRFVQN